MDSTGEWSEDWICMKLLNGRGGMLQETIEDGWLCDFIRVTILPDPHFFSYFLGEVPL